MTNTTTGRVITRFGAELIAQTDEGETLRCTAKRKFEQIACGDYVTIEIAEHGISRVVAIAPRHNALTRPDFRGKIRTIAANIDQVIIILSWLPEPFWGLVDRYLIAASLLNTEAILVINKSDLASQYATNKSLEALQEYQKIGYTLIETEAVDQEHNRGISNLQQALNNNTNILVGQSGVGKSSLAQLLLTDVDIRVGDISNSGEGQHTTTTTTLYTLPSGGFLIDSPGVRDYTLPPDISAQDLKSGYREFADYSQHCKFNNCTHNHEPQCKVRDAYEAGDIPPKRYKRYIYLLSELNE